jgi:hypothetical protein
VDDAQTRHFLRGSSNSPSEHRTKTEGARHINKTAHRRNAACGAESRRRELLFGTTAERAAILNNCACAVSGRPPPRRRYGSIACAPACSTSAPSGASARRATVQRSGLKIVESHCHRALRARGTAAGYVTGRPCRHIARKRAERAGTQGGPDARRSTAPTSIP